MVKCLHLELGYMNTHIKPTFILIFDILGSISERH